MARHQQTILNRMRDRLVSPIKQEVYKSIEADIQKQLQDKSHKQPFEWDIPIHYNNLNSTKKKPVRGAISWQMMRDISTNYDIARLCINTIKKKMYSLDWDIVPKNREDKTDYKKQIDEVKEFFERPSGNASSFRTFIDEMIEDVLVIDALSIYKKKKRNSELISIHVIDGSTIKLRLDQLGATPEPPEVAYEQWIKGQHYADFTTWDMIYKRRNLRPNTPYGLSPIESLALVAEGALSNTLYNMAWLTDGNIPPGVLRVPEEWTPDQIRQYKEWWDALLAGNDKTRQQLLMAPGGAGTGYEEFKRPEDMAFSKFQMFLLKVTCAFFGLNPQDIGFTEDVRAKATSETQDDAAKEKGLKADAKFFYEIFDDIIQNELGYKELKFVFLGIEESDLKTEAEIDEIYLKTGVVSPNEVRIKQGMNPYEGGDFKSKEKEQTEDKESVEEDNNNEQEEDNKESDKESKDEEMKAFMNKSMNDLEKKNKRKFIPRFLEQSLVDEIEGELENAKSKSEVKNIFKYYQSKEYGFIAKAKELSREITKALES